MNFARLWLAASLLAASSPAMACACCGEDDDSYAQELTPSSVYADDIEAIRFGPGWIYDVGLENLWEVSGISRSGDGFVFHTEIGDFQFLVEQPPVYRHADITFITQPDSGPSKMNDIYHEVEIVGVISFSAEAASQLGAKSVDAVLLLQGVGTACLEADTFRRWLFRGTSERERLSGSGSLIVPSL